MATITADTRNEAGETLNTLFIDTNNLLNVRYFNARDHSHGLYFLKISLKDGKNFEYCTQDINHAQKVNQTIQDSIANQTDSVIVFNEADNYLY